MWQRRRQSDEALPETGGFGVELSAALSMLLLGALVGRVRLFALLWSIRVRRMASRLRRD